MKKIIFYSLLALVIASCGNNNQESNPEVDSLKTVTSDLNVQLSEKESVVLDFVKSMNDIQATLDEIKGKQNIINTADKNIELQKPQQEQIAEDLSIINKLLEQNKAELNNLRTKLKKSKGANTDLQEMLDRVMRQVEEKDAEIIALKDKLVKTNAALENLFTEYNNRIEDIEQKDVELNTAYYAFGTEKELKKNGILTSEGGFIGIGKNVKLSADFNRDYFTKIDITTTPTISLMTKKAKLITTHPSSSYRFDKSTDGKIEKITITNNKQFWSASKYLVIIVE